MSGVSGSFPFDFSRVSAVLTNNGGVLSFLSIVFMLVLCFQSFLTFKIKQEGTHFYSSLPKLSPEKTRETRRSGIHWRFSPEKVKMSVGIGMAHWKAARVSHSNIRLTANKLERLTTWNFSTFSRARTLTVEIRLDFIDWSRKSVSRVHCEGVKLPVPFGPELQRRAVDNVSYRVWTSNVGDFLASPMGTAAKRILIHDPGIL